MKFFWLIYPILYSSVLWIFFFVRNFNRKWHLWFKIREKKEGVKVWLNFPENTSPLWFHCSSGEYEYAKPVIREIKKKYPFQKILVTYFSPSVKKSLSESTNIDFHCPTPWDRKTEWKEFLDHHKPKALLITRTDLWPMMIMSAKKAKVPCLLYSITLGRAYKGPEKWIKVSLLKRVDRLFCVGEEDKKKLETLLTPPHSSNHNKSDRGDPRLREKAKANQSPGASKIHVYGDTRWEQCFFRLKKPKKLKPLNNFNRPVFVAGSTWPKDEKVLIPFIKNFFKEISFIVCPHEPTAQNLHNLTENIKSSQLDFQFYTKTEDWNPFSILIVNQVGILADLYAWGSFAFVGGSMDKGVHSVMEPLAQGLLCFVGPNHLNNREALDLKKTFVKGIAPVQVIENTDDLIQKFSRVQSRWKKNQQFSLKLSLNEKKGAGKKLLNWLETKDFFQKNGSK